MKQFIVTWTPPKRPIEIQVVGVDAEHAAILAYEEPALWAQAIREAMDCNLEVRPMTRGDEA